MGIPWHRSNVTFVATGAVNHNPTIDKISDFFVILFLITYVLDKILVRIINLLIINFIAILRSLSVN
jgi:hypothetical protein